ncbi:MAG: hypothetical protein C0483_23780 [Pirellula sp.]|nr:hypothetical protein [Pirellula sp.]
MDLFEQLADVRVPPPPKSLVRHVHRRLNRWLLALHLVEFVIHVVPYAAGHFVRAVLGWLLLTISGEYEKKK